MHTFGARHLSSWHFTNVNAKTYYALREITQPESAMSVRTRGLYYASLGRFLFNCCATKTTVQKLGSEVLTNASPTTVCHCARHALLHLWHHHPSTTLTSSSFFFYFFPM